MAAEKRRGGNGGFKRKDYRGKIFNFLTGVEFSHRILSGRSGTTYWKFLCVCGKEKILSACAVVTGRTKSCGCVYKSLLVARKLSDDAVVFSMAYSQHIFSAKKRGFPSALTKEEYYEIIKRPCTYCGGMSKRKHPINRKLVNSNSADRLNNEPYYTLQNTVPACFICQRMKGKTPSIDFLLHAQKVTSFQSR